EAIRLAAVLLEPIMPSSCREILRRVGVSGEGLNFDRDGVWRNAGERVLLEEGPLWPRIDSGRTHGSAPTRAASAGADPTRAASAGADPTRAASAGADPTRAASAGADPTRAASVGADPRRAASVGADPRVGPKETTTVSDNPLPPDGPSPGA